MNILFVCTGNTCRSPMAATLAKSMAHDMGLSWTIDSAGTYASPNHPMTQEAVNAMIRRRIPITNHTSKSVTAELIHDADIVLTMTDRHRTDLQNRFPEEHQKIYELVEFVDDEGGQSPSKYGIVDPFGGSDADYEACATELERLIRQLIHKLRDTPEA